MLNVKFIQVYQQLIELSQNGGLLWSAHNASEFPYLDTDAVLSAVYKTRYKDRNMIIYQQRVSFNRGITRNETVCDFVDNDGNKVGEMPRAQGINELYHKAFMQNRDPKIAELDKVVAALTEMTRAGKVEWTVQEAKDFADLDPDVVSMSVYQLEYRGRRFITFKELMAAISDAELEARTALWVVDAKGKKVNDLKSAEGIDKLYATVASRLQRLGVETSKLDKVIDQLVGASVQQLATVIKAEKARQAAKAAAQGSTTNTAPPEAAPQATTTIATSPADSASAIASAVPEVFPEVFPEVLPASGDEA
jgi:predicted signal transduction protein with EAL and GGDEF domain